MTTWSSGDDARARCVACGDPVQPGQRWCSKSCFYAEDGYPDVSDREDDDDTSE